MTDVRVVGTPVACAGFALAGLPTREVLAAKDGPAAIAAETAREDTGVLLVEQALLDALDPAAERQLMRRTTPVVVPFPSPSWREREEVVESTVLQLLQRAIGYRVRL
jgi:vacuolar-type H+-ATPase subunit F/Vma7